MNTHYSSVNLNRPFPLSTYHQCHCTAFARLQVYPKHPRGVTKNVVGSEPT